MREKAKYKWTEAQFRKAVKTSFTINEVAIKLGYIGNKNYATIKSFIINYQLDITHFTSNVKNLIDKIKLGNKDNSGERRKIKKLIIKNNLIPYYCAICLISTWTDENLIERPIALHLDHINGMSNDHSLENLSNLRFLCPNCHSMTDTYCGKNNKIFEDNHCLDCGKIITKEGERCMMCYRTALTLTSRELTEEKKNRMDKLLNMLGKEGHHTPFEKSAIDTLIKIPENKYLKQPKRKFKINWPPIEYLIKRVKESGFEAVGRELGVSGKGVKKHIQNNIK